jgi:hypothetical protein
MILHLVQCDGCGETQPVGVIAASAERVNMNGRPIHEGLTFIVPSKVKQIDGKHLCSWACVANYAETQQGREVPGA